MSKAKPNQPKNNQNNQDIEGDIIDCQTMTYASFCYDAQGKQRFMSVRGVCCKPFSSDGKLRKLISRKAKDFETASDEIMSNELKRFLDVDGQSVVHYGCNFEYYKYPISSGDFIVATTIDLEDGTDFISGPPYVDVNIEKYNQSEIVPILVTYVDVTKNLKPIRPDGIEDGYWRAIKKVIELNLDNLRQKKLLQPS